MPNNTWKDYAKLLAGYRAVGDIVAYGQLVNDILNEPTTAITSTMVWREDDDGKPYAGMQQAALGRELIRGGQVLDTPVWIDYGQRMLEVCKRRVRNGGLRANESSWVYSRTSTKPGNDGYTLNQEVLLARDMIVGGRLIGRYDYEEIGVKAIEQLSRADRFPNAWNFTLSGGAKRSWLYYSIKDGKGGFIASKTGGYTILTLRELCALSARGTTIDWRPLKPWLQHCADSYRAKGNIYIDSRPAAGGNWEACRPDVTPLSPYELDWMDNPE